MENASKALIIAGAILIAILIIGLGVFIFNQAANTFDNNQFDQLAVQQFNAQFEPYEGNQMGSEVRQLLQKVISNNYTYSDDESMQVKVNGSIISDSHKLGGSTITFGKTYSVSFERSNNNGMIYNIEISDGLVPVDHDNSFTNMVDMNEINHRP